MSEKFGKFLAIWTALAVVFAHSVMSFAAEGGHGDTDGALEEAADATANTANVAPGQAEMEKFSLKVEDFEALEGANVAGVSATEDAGVDEAAAAGVPSADESPSPEELEEKRKQQEQFLQRIEAEFNLTKSGYRQLLNDVAETQKRLEKVSEDKMTLKDQLDVLDGTITLTTGKLVEVIAQVVETENAIALLYEQIETKEVEVMYQESLLKDYVKVIYQEENNYFTVDEEGEVSAFKLLLADGSVGTNLKELKYFEVLNEAGQQMLTNLHENYADLESKKEALSKKRADLIKLQDGVAAEREQLQLQREAKEKLLEITLGQEQVFSRLVEETKKQEEEMLNDLKSLSEAMNFIEQQMAKDGADFDPADYADLLDDKTQALLDFQYTHVESGDGFAWPVKPDLGISAYFHDAGYYGTFGVQHSAIDIPVYQGSPVRTAEDGVVYTVRDNGYGYSFIILAHANKVTTVYGHISSILVEEGQVVSKGAIIGLSGGMPGTKGAGTMTTGPHLHFEMLLDGVHTDPLGYLPLDIFDEEDIEAMPEKYFADWEKAVRKENGILREPEVILREEEDQL